MAAASSAAFLLLSLPALAAPPEPAPVLPAEPAASVPIAVEPAPAPELAGEALRIVEGPAPAPMPEEPPVVMPAPVVEPVACVPDQPRYLGKRPAVGTGLLVGGASLLAVASALVVISTVGSNEAGLSSNLSLPIGLSTIPIIVVGVTTLVSGINTNQKYTRWVADNGLDAPAAGNGMMAAGVVLSAAGAISMGFAIDHNLGLVTPDLGDRMWTGMSGTTLAAGVMLVGGGVIQRSRFAAWEGIGYVRPGFYAGRGGTGLSISGRF